MSYLLLLTGLLKAIIDIDTSIFLAANSHHAPFWDSFMWLYSDKWVWAPLYMAVFYVLLRNYSWRVAVACLLTGILVIALTDQISSTLIRPEVARLRPSNPENPLSAYVHTVNNYHGGSYGFPSAHAANSWGLVFYLAWLVRRRWVTAFFCCWALLQCYSRLYLGVHYFGDLLVGMLLGLVCGTVVYHAYRYACRQFDANLSPLPTKHIYAPVLTGVGIVVYILAISALQSFHLIAFP